MPVRRRETPRLELMYPVRYAPAMGTVLEEERAGAQPAPRRQTDSALPAMPAHDCGRGSFSAKIPKSTATIRETMFA